MTIRPSIARLEKQRKQTALLASNDVQQFNFHKGQSAKGAKADDVLTLRIERDVSATRKVADETKEIRGN